MKTRLPILLLLLLACFGCGTEQEEQKEPVGLHGEITISGAFALYPMMNRWASEFRKLNPGVEFDIRAEGTGTGMEEVLAGAVDMGMASRSVTPEETQQGALHFAVAKDAVIPTINASNPYIDVLYSKGVTREQLRAVWLTGKITNWNELTGSGSLPIRIYTRSDAAGAAEIWASFLGGKQEELKGIGVFGDLNLAEEVINEKAAIGYNNINHVYNIHTKHPYQGIAPLPLDLNGNGTLDKNEFIYDSLEELNQAIAKGVFPSPPARPLYLVTKGKPTKKVVMEFIVWILHEGQQYVEETGYVRLTEDRLAGELNKLEN
ncbi:PstS family phosphate ABC transporter substrate-binding protein [Pontibacter litorisediminis]|uniref:PstS family phosphate ABC transporter substrate-binding protein n=1 Tax=Pontibacter litorisediminis TaxID=1846260 RepID=UPI0023EACFE9|nr:substrate-binding domain-containing protein [Pontibacter litorisediminis]